MEDNGWARSAVSVERVGWDGCRGEVLGKTSRRGLPLEEANTPLQKRRLPSLSFSSMGKAPMLASFWGPSNFGLNLDMHLDSDDDHDNPDR